MTPPDKQPLWQQYEDWEDNQVHVGSGGGGKRKIRSLSSETSHLAREAHIKEAQENRKDAAKLRIISVLKHFPTDSKEQPRFINIYTNWLNRELNKRTPYELNREEVKIDRIRPKQTAGGQNVNKTSTAIRVHHTPSAIFVRSEESRDQIANEAVALATLTERLSKHLADWKVYHNSPVVSENEIRDLIVL
jgi:hypothetical protein